MTLTQSLKETYASVGGSAILETLELNHPTFSSPFRIVRNHDALTAGLENNGGTATFQPYIFKVVPPSKTERGNQSMNITIGNVSRDMSDLLETAQANTDIPITVIYRIYLSTATSSPQNDPPLQLTLSNVSANKTQVTGTASKEDIINRHAPSIKFDDRFFSLGEI